MFRPITINAVLNGWIVMVGCQTVVYQDRNQLVTDLDAYLKDPAATEARFLKTAVNQAHMGGAVEAAAPPPRESLRVDRAQPFPDAPPTTGSAPR